MVVTKVHQLIRERQLLAVRVQGVLRVPAEFIHDGLVVKGLPATITLLRDAGYNDEEMHQLAVHRGRFAARQPDPGAAGEPRPRGAPPGAGRRVLIGTGGRTDGRTTGTAGQWLARSRVRHRARRHGSPERVGARLRCDQRELIAGVIDTVPARASPTRPAFTDPASPSTSGAPVSGDDPGEPAGLRTGSCRSRHPVRPAAGSAVSAALAVASSRVRLPSTRSSPAGLPVTAGSP